MDSDVRGSEGVELPMDNRSGVVVAVASTLIPLAALVVALRFYARHHLDRWVGIDDWAVLISLVRSRRCEIWETPLGIVLTCLSDFYRSQGHHDMSHGRGGAGTTPVEPKRVADRAILQGQSTCRCRLCSAISNDWQQRFYFTIIMYYCALGSIKIALLLQYRRIFGSKLRRVVNIALLVIGSWSIGLVLVSIFTCHPISGYWIKDLKATCIPTYQWYIHSAGNITSDIVIFTLPIPILWNMKVSTRQRLLLILVFSLGLL